jgi:hypothetical protein
MIAAQRFVGFSFIFSPLFHGAKAALGCQMVCFSTKNSDLGKF